MIVKAIAARYPVEMLESPATRARPTAAAEAQTALSPSLGRSLGYVLHRAFLYMQGTYLDAFRGELHPRELTLIARLLASGGSSQQELADCMSVNRSVMVHHIDDLQRAGLVARDRDASDRRRYCLRATDRAVELLAWAAPTLRAADEQTTRRLSAGQRRQLAALLTLLLGDALPAVVAPVSEMTGYLIARAHFMTRSAAEELCAPLGLDVREFGTLQAINDFEPCSQQHVATMLGVSGPVVVELIDALEPRGLVVRERNPADRRSYALRQTPAGARLRKSAWSALGALEAQLDARLGNRAPELCELLRATIGAARAI
jgi:DNA-binding MarR family transcriptional regulator